VENLCLAIPCMGFLVKEIVKLLYCRCKKCIAVTYAGAISAAKFLEFFTEKQSQMGPFGHSRGSLLGDAEFLPRKNRLKRFWG